MENNKFKSKLYLHFDNQIEFKEVENYVENFKQNSKHNFLPLIFDEITFDKFESIENIDQDKAIKQNGKIIPIKRKNRPIMYASHLDNYIYKYYGIELNIKYNNYLKEFNFDDSPTAYRTNKNGKSNIHFAAEVINFIKNNPGCYIYIGDFSKFFETLDHAYLKKQLKNIYYDEHKKIPTHQYEIFKNITRYSFIHKKDILFYTDKKKGKYKPGYHRVFAKTSDLRLLKKEKTRIKQNSPYVLQVNEDKFGIPQGTAISALYANIYMLEIDKQITDIIEQHKGIYRRYSDDYIIILPQQPELSFYDLKTRINTIINSEGKLEIHPDKTQTMKYLNNKLFDLTSHKYTHLDYLGFTFDGINVKMREKSIYKYYRTAYKLIKKGTIISKKNGYTGSDARLALKRKLYQNYHILGENPSSKYKYKNREHGTFITYALKSQDIFDKLSPNTVNLMNKQISNHEKKLKKRIYKAKSELKKDATIK